eukprot:scaffold55068_cov33-Phaeocystis_antarctica.AAC.1
MQAGAGRATHGCSPWCVRLQPTRSMVAAHATDGGCPHTRLQPMLHTVAAARAHLAHAYLERQP